MLYFFLNIPDSKQHRVKSRTEKTSRYINNKPNKNTKTKTTKKTVKSCPFVTVTIYHDDRKT